MENPATWGEAERTVQRTLDAFYVNQAKPVTDETKTVFGLSLSSQITSALREKGLLKDGE